MNTMMDSTLAQLIGHVVDLELKNQQLEIEKQQQAETIKALEALTQQKPQADNKNK
jgi:hypothetical protein